MVWIFILFLLILELKYNKFDKHWPDLFNATAHLSNENTIELYVYIWFQKYKD